MSPSDAWSPDEPSGSDPFEQGDEALDESEALDPGFLEAVEDDPTLGPYSQADERELEEIDAELDDPEGMVTLEGGIDDPDGLGRATERERERSDDDEGWDLDEPIVPAADDIEDEPGIEPGQP